MATDYTTLTDEELQAEQDAIIAEATKRHTLVSIPQQMDTLNKGYLDAEGTTTGDPWRQPTGAHDAYPMDWKVSHNDKDWVSLVAGNVWEPGVSGWREETGEGGGYPEWVQPTGAHDAYNIGDKVHYTPLVKDYESKIDGNSYSPEAYPAGWQEISAP